jgi:hypothetical protein
MQAIQKRGKIAAVREILVSPKLARQPPFSRLVGANLRSATSISSSFGRTIQMRATIPTSFAEHLL